MLGVTRNVWTCTTAARYKLFTRQHGQICRHSLIRRCSSNKSNVETSCPGKLQDCHQISEYIRSIGIMSDAQINSILSGLEGRMSNVPSQDGVRGVEMIWTDIESSGSPLTTSQYNTLLKLYLKMSDDFDPLSFLLRMQRNNIEINQETYDLLFEELLSTGATSKMASVLDFIKTNGLLLPKDCLHLILSTSIQKGDMINANHCLGILKTVFWTEPEKYGRLFCDMLSQGNWELLDLLLENWKSDPPFFTSLFQFLLPSSDSTPMEKISERMKGHHPHLEVEDILKRLIDKDCPLKLLLAIQNSLSAKNMMDIIKLYVGAQKHPSVIIGVLEELATQNHEDFLTLATFAFENSIHSQYYEFSSELISECEKRGLSACLLTQESLRQVIDITDKGLLKTLSTRNCYKLDTFLFAFYDVISRQSPKTVMESLGSIYNTSSSCSITETLLKQGNFYSASNFVKYCGIEAPTLGLNAVKHFSYQPLTTAKAAEFVEFIFASAVQLLWHDEVLEKFCPVLSNYIVESGSCVDCRENFTTGREYFGKVLDSISESQNEELLAAFVTGLTKYGLGLPSSVNISLSSPHASRVLTIVKPLSNISLANICIPFHSEVLRDPSFSHVDKKLWLQDNISNHVFSLTELTNILKEISIKDFSELELPPQFELVVRLQYLLTHRTSTKLKQTTFTWTSEADKTLYTLAMCQLMASKANTSSTLNLLQSIPMLQPSDLLSNFIVKYLDMCSDTILKDSIPILKARLPSQVTDSIWWSIVSKDLEGAVDKATNSLQEYGMSKHIILLTVAFQEPDSILLNKLYASCFDAHMKFCNSSSISQVVAASLFLKDTEFVRKKISKLRSYPDVIDSIIDTTLEFGADTMRHTAQLFSKMSLTRHSALAYAYLIRFYYWTGNWDEAKSLVESVESSASKRPVFQHEVFNLFGGALELYNRLDLLLEKNLLKEAHSQRSLIPRTSSFGLRLAMCCFLGNNIKVYQFLKNYFPDEYYSDAINVQRGQEDIVLNKLSHKRLCEGSVKSPNSGLLYAIATLLKNNNEKMNEITQNALNQKAGHLVYLLWQANLCIGNETAAKDLEDTCIRWERPFFKKMANFSSYTDIIAESLNTEELETHMYFLEKHGCMAALQRAKVLYALILMMKNDSYTLVSLRNSLSGLPLEYINEISHDLILGERTQFNGNEFLFSVLNDFVTWRHDKKRSSKNQMFK